MAVTHRRRALSPLILGLLLAQCGKDGAGPGTLTPAVLVLISGNHQTGTVGQNSQGGQRGNQPRGPRIL